MSPYTEHPEVRAILAELRLEALQNPERFQRSGIRDAAGRQYVDLVMEGGGTLGTALLGYLYILEQMNFRFLQIAGTSAGSIVALLLAAAGPIDAAKTEWIIAKMAAKAFSDFIDGGKDAEQFMQALLDEDVQKRKKARFTAKNMDDLKEHYGINPGDAFYEWLSGLLAERGVYTLADLKALRGRVPEGINCAPERWARVAFVAAEISTGTKIALPDAAALYWAEPDAVNPSHFVRASMSVPVFFYPMRVGGLPQGEAAQARWAASANYFGPIPPEALFVDGGAMSNFPLSLLRPEGESDAAPLFAIKIGQDRTNYNACDSFGGFAGAILGSMMSFYDNDYLVRYPEMRHSVGVIDSGEHSWLDFYLSDADKVDLFVRGARAAKTFLSAE